MPDPRNLPNYGDPVLRLQREIKALEKRVAQLESGSRPTIPIYSPQDLADLVDQNAGEFWIDSSDNNMYYLYPRNTARKVSSTP